MRVFEDSGQWLARAQDTDFGIDFEGELVAGDPLQKTVRGHLLKVQVKSSTCWNAVNDHISVSLARSWIDYALNFRLPVILLLVSTDTGECWWLWVQEWALQNEEAIASSRRSALTLRIPSGQTLSSAMRSALPSIAAGQTPTAMVLALRSVLDAAHGWEHAGLARGLVALLGKTPHPSRDWMLDRIIDHLVGLGLEAPYWLTQQSLPTLFAIVDENGTLIRKEQIVRCVKRGEVSSRVGIDVLSRLYWKWPEHAATLRLPEAFSDANVPGAAWYCAMRERFPGEQSLGLFLPTLPDGVRDHQGVALRIDKEFREYVFPKWPNRGDSILQDCLYLVDPPLADDSDAIEDGAHPGAE